MVNRQTMTNWVLGALKSLGGHGTIMQICKKVWEMHREEITGDAEMVYKWQYEIRWSGNMLRRERRLKQASESPRGIWELS